MLHFKRLLIPTKVTKLVYLLTIIMSIIVIFPRLISRHEKIGSTQDVMHTVQKYEPISPKPEMVYILRWINPSNRPIDVGDGSVFFAARNCAWSNCYLTERSDLLRDFSRFNVILFDASDMAYFESSRKLPKRRALRQKFIFVSGTAAATTPICDKIWNGYFNWTWTYKLDSTLVWRYFVIKNTKSKVIGPRREMHWLKLQQMLPVDSRFIMKLRSKTKIAAWFVSNCKTESHREEFVSEVQGYLSEYKLEVDIYGNCGMHICPKSAMKNCLRMLAKEYYFYFAFENAISEDYVTDIVLHALNHDTVPVVFGGANYTRFLPDGSYLNALQYGPERLARRMFEIMQNPSVYQMFFRWRNHYSYHAHSETPQTDNYCSLCALVNKEKEFSAYSSMTHFKRWWTPKRKCTEE